MQITVEIDGHRGFRGLPHLCKFKEGSKEGRTKRIKDSVVFFLKQGDSEWRR